jgi:4-phytase/acid phosphatase
MKLRFVSSFLLAGLTAGFCFPPAGFAQQAQVAGSSAPSKLEYVVMLSRHGVRPPLTAPGAIDKYSAAPWPQWEVQPGYLTPHGYELMKIFGGWDRSRFSGSGLLSASGCADASGVDIVADSDERTRETGKALAEGMYLGCAPEVHAKAEGAPDPLFLGGKATPDDAELARQAILGRIGNDPGNVTRAYSLQLAALDGVLAGCGKVKSPNPNRTSIFDIPVTPTAPGMTSGFRGPLPAASTLVENLLLEVTDGMKDPGWGCLNGNLLRQLMQIDTVAWDIGFRTPAEARIYGSNLLAHIQASIAQHVAGRPVAGAVGSPSDRLLILIGHDINIVTVSGILGMDWIVDGRFDDTPPGGALLFELWNTGGRRTVRVEYTAQTLEQMHNSQPLTAANPPVTVPVFVPGCSGRDMACSWEGFAAAVSGAIDPKYVQP